MLLKSKFSNFVECMMPQSTQEQLNKEHVDLTYGKWATRGIDSFYANIVSLGCEYFLVSNNNNNKIIKQIRDITFNQLLHLNLSNNIIESLQAFIGVQMPSLECLDISSNKIYTFKSLAKLTAPKIKTLHLQENSCPQTSSEHFLSKIYAPCLDIVSIDYYFFQKVVLEDVATFIKLQTQALQELYMDSRNRIIQNQVMKQIKQKYLKVKIGIQALQMGKESDDDEESGQQLTSESDSYQSMEHELFETQSNQ